MKSKIALISILTNNVPEMVRFYRDVLGLKIKVEVGDYVEFESEGVRFSICHRNELVKATGHPEFKESRRGQSFELAFPLATPEEVDLAYSEIIAKGASSIKEPSNMPWGQRTAFFADPDGNIHELFSDLNKA